jgi:hypothetical protein
MVPSPVLRSNSVEIAPFLLNSGDLFDLQIISTGADPTPRVGARIAGVKEVRARRRVYNPGNGPDGALDRSNKVFYTIFGVFILALLALYALAPMENESGTPVAFEQRLPMILVTVGIFGLYIAFLRWATIRNRRWRPAARF